MKKLQKNLLCFLLFLLKLCLLNCESYAEMLSMNHYMAYVM